LSYLIKFLLIALVSVFVASTNTHAYDKATKAEILDDVIKTCPVELATFLSKNRQSIEKRLKDSRDVKDIKSYNMEDSFQVLVAKIKNRKNDPYNTIIRLAQSINDISDYINPGSNYKKKEACKEVTVPYIFEYVGFNDISDTRELLTNIEEKTGKNRCYKKLSREGNDVVYSTTVNTISDYFINAWFKASNEGGNVKSKFQIVRKELKPSTNKEASLGDNSDAFKRAMSNIKFYNLDHVPDESEATSHPEKNSKASTRKTYTKTQNAPARAESFTGPQKNAVRSAKNYLSFQGFSRSGLINQLSSDYGDGYSVADATVAVDSLNTDWNKQAVRSAKNYLSFQGFSCKGLIDQLSSSYGDGYTKSQANYGARRTSACQ